MGSLLETDNSLIIFGPPASGKTNVSAFLSEILNYPVVSGAQVMPELAGLYKDKRQLIPDQNFVPALGQLLYSLTQGQNYIFENLPRTSDQAELIVQWSANISRGLLALELVLPGGVDDSLLRSRNRQECVECRATFHSIVKPFSERTCGKNDCNLRYRAGDSEELIREGYLRYERLKRQFLPELLRAKNVRHVQFSMTSSLKSDLENIKTKIFN